MMYKGYVNTLDSKYAQIKKYSDQANSTRKFQRGSEDPVGAIKTLKTCHEYTANAQYMTNQQQASTFVSTTETYVKEINSVCSTALEKATEAVNGDKNESDLKNYATGMENYRDEIMTSLNSIYTGRYVFGGSSTESTPFRLNSSNKLQVYDYGNKLSGKADADGYINVSELTEDDVKTLDSSLVSQIDVGTGTPFNMRTSALQTIIMDYSGSSSTATNIVDKMTDAINSASHDGFSSLMGNISDVQNSITRVEVNIGERENKLTQIKTSLTDKKTNLTSALSDCYEVDQVNAIMHYNIAETIYNESLSMASTVLQNSIIDFLK
jgi:flagellar hook-associated protein 3 FlgL